MNRLKASVVLALLLTAGAIGCANRSGEPAGPTQIRYGDDPAQFGWLTVPPEADDTTVTVVLVHGGFWKEPWDYTLMNPLSEALVSEGYATWNIEFRRLGGRGGWPNTFDDVAAAIDHLSVISDEHPVSLDRVTVVGHSSGGHLAMWSLGRSNPVVRPVGVVGLAPIVDLTAADTAAELLGGSPDDVPDRYQAAAPLLDPDRVVVLHGADDTTVGSDHADAALAAGIRVERLAGVDHFEIIEPDGPTWPILLQELERMVS